MGPIFCLKIIILDLLTAIQPQLGMEISKMLGWVLPGRCLLSPVMLRSMRLLAIYLAAWLQTLMAYPLMLLSFSKISLLC